ncbi:MAG: hypothetical protein AB7U23_16210 [Dehalococcoidia bacterium]
MGSTRTESLDRRHFVSAIWLLALATGATGWFPPQIEGIVSVLLVPFLTAQILRPGPSLDALRPGVGAELVRVGLLLAFTSAWLMLPAWRLVLIGALLAVSLRSGGGRLATVRCAAIVVALYAVWWFGYTTSTQFYSAVQTTARAYTRAISRPFGVPLDLGATAAAVHVFVLGLISIAAVQALRERRALGRTAAVVIAFVLLHAIHVLLVAPGIATFLQPSLGQLTLPLALSWVLMALLTAAAWPALRAVHFAVPLPAHFSIARLGACIGVMILAGVLAWPKSKQAPLLEGNVLIYDKGYLAWSSPDFESFGLHSGGMFGLLPMYLEARGLQVRRVAALDAESLRWADAIVFINLLDALSADEHDAVWAAVDNGSGMLLLGDHTGVAGIREPFNDLLSPVGIEFGFDSVKPFLSTWRAGLRSFPGIVTTGATDRFEVGVGASLSMSQPADVVVSAVSGFADAGNMENADNAYLGNMSYDAGEPLGDIPVVVACTHGRGRLLVFGDTSPFQNGSLGKADRFVTDCLRWLLNLGGSQSPAAAYRVALATVAIGLALWFLLRSRILSLLLLAALPVASATAQRAAAVDDPPLALPQPWVPTAVDLGHGSEVDEMWWQPNSQGGLLVNLHRNRLWHFETRDIESALPLARCAILPAATLPYSSAEVRALDSFLRARGLVIASTGHDGHEGSERLLQKFGVTIGRSPFGPVEVAALGETVRFWCAYPIEGYPEGMEVLVEAYGRPVVGLLPVGPGALLVISDSRFLSNGNLEGRDFYVRENVHFLRALFEHLRASGRL